MLGQIADVFHEQRFGVSALAMDRARSDTFSEVAILFRNSSTVGRRLVSRLCALGRIISVGRLNDSSSVAERLLLVGVGGSPTAHRRVHSTRSTFNTGAISCSGRSVVLRLANGAGGVSSFVGLVESFRVLRVYHANIMSLRHNNRAVVGGARGWQGEWAVVTEVFCRRRYSLRGLTNGAITVVNCNSRNRTRTLGLGSSNISIVMNLCRNSGD